MNRILRRYIREILQVFESGDKEDDRLLVEPDDVDDPKGKKEMNTVAGGAGGIRGAMATGTKPKKKKRKPVYGKVTSDQ